MSREKDDKIFTWVVLSMLAIVVVAGAIDGWTYDERHPPRARVGAKCTCWDDLSAPSRREQCGIPAPRP